MAATRLEGILGAAFSLLRLDARPDAELLTRFLDERDEIAFETLLVRHTPAVRAACRGWLRSAADIDDAAQATFLILVQRAQSIRSPNALAPWLYGVATRVARRLRQYQKRFAKLPENLPDCQTPPDRDLHDMLAEEVARLPEKYRLPVQLCYWSGLTTAEAAQRLGWPKGTLLTRLAWARKRLGKRLARSGVSQAAFAGLVEASAPVVGEQWVHRTAPAAKGILAGEPLAGIGVSERTISLIEGVMRAMFWDKIKYIALAVLVTVGLAGYGIGQWGADAPRGRGTQKEEGFVRSARDREPENRHALEKESAKTEEARPDPSGRRREVIIRLPSGTFVKEVDVAPYGHGRVTWTYEDERVVGLIEGSVMGGEFELATEAEYSLSSNGTIYGLLTSVRLTHLRLPDLSDFEALKPFVGLWPAIEPLVNDTLMDLPFSYHFRVQGDRLIISDFRILLSGPNPFGKLGAILPFTNGNGELALAIACVQGLGTALEGTYFSSDGKEKPAPKQRPVFQKSRGQIELKRQRVLPPARQGPEGQPVPGS
jgi:RNA polymerase sigma factor (sigma-70 family)